MDAGSDQQVGVETLSTLTLERRIGFHDGTWLDRHFVADTKKATRDAGFERDVPNAECAASPVNG